MSKISLEPNDSGAGTFSIVSPDSNTNRTLNLPDADGEFVSLDNNGNLTVTSGDITVNSGDITVNSGNLTADGGVLDVKKGNLDEPVAILHNSSTARIGDGQVLELRTERGTGRTGTVPIFRIVGSFGGTSPFDLFNIQSDGDIFSVTDNDRNFVMQQWGLRAWVNFDGTDSTIRSSGNVSSITEVSGGYLVNFVANMPDNKYSVSGVAEGRNTSTATVGLDDGLGIGPEEVSRFAIRTRANSDNSVQRPRTVCIMVVR